MRLNVYQLVIASFAEYEFECKYRIQLIYPASHGERQISSILAILNQYLSKRISKTLKIAPSIINIVIIHLHFAGKWDIIYLCKQVLTQIDRSRLCNITTRVFRQISVNVFVLFFKFNYRHVCFLHVVSPCMKIRRKLAIIETVDRHWQCPYGYGLPI